MGAAISIRQQRLDQRLEALESEPVFAAKPILNFLHELQEDRKVLERMLLSNEELDAFRTRLTEACERAIELGWLPPSEVAKLVKKDADTVRRWCKAGKVIYRQGSNGYLVDVRSALRFAKVG